MKITGRMLAGYGESADVLAFEQEHPDGCEATPEVLNGLTTKGVDVVLFCEEILNGMTQAEQEAVGAKYGALKVEETEISNIYVLARTDLRKAWKDGTMDRKTYLEECGAVRAVFVAQLKAFRKKAELRSYEIMSEFLASLPE